MSRTIAIANQKGGTAKTTTTANLGAALVNLGARVLLVDLDPQGALTVTLGRDPYVIRPSSHDMLARGVLSGLDHAIAPGLALIPANAELVSVEYQLMKEPGRVQRLRHALAPLREKYDYILIDTPPSLGLLTINALAAAHELLIPVATDYLAMRGVRALLDSVWLIREKANPGLELLGVLPTLYRAGSHSQAVVAEMRKVFKSKVFQTVIPVDEAAAVAPAIRQAVVNSQPNSPAAQAYMRFAEEVHHDSR